MIDCGKKLYRSEGIRVFGRGKLNICISPTLNLFILIDYYNLIVKMCKQFTFCRFFQSKFEHFSEIMLN